MSAKLKECSCAECQEACKNKPGWFHPDDIDPLAEQLGLTPEQLFAEHLTIDYWNGDEITDHADIFVLSPRTNDQPGGDMFGANPHGTCHWFVDGKCAIHGPNKPAECRQWNHAVPKEKATKARRNIVRAWVPHQERITALLGREPEAEAFTIFDLLSASLRLT